MSQNLTRMLLDAWTAGAEAAVQADPEKAAKAASTAEFADWLAGQLGATTTADNNVDGNN